MHEAMREPGAEKFFEAMQTEVDNQLGNGNFLLNKLDKMPKGWISLPKVRQMKCREVEGSREREHYQVYVPVVSWTLIKILLALSSIKNKQAMCSTQMISS